MSGADLSSESLSETPAPTATPAQGAASRQENVYGPPAGIAFDSEPPFPWWLRTIFVGIGATLIGLLVTAAFLSPSPAGFGTHRQLGLPSCGMIRMFGIRCPSCGMTTSWTYLVRGRLIASQQANTGGMLLGLATIFTGPWLLASGLKGWWFWVVPKEYVVVAIGAGIILITLADWTVRLMNR